MAGEAHICAHSNSLGSRAILKMKECGYSPQCEKMDSTEVYQRSYLCGVLIQSQTLFLSSPFSNNNCRLQITFTWAIIFYSSWFPGLFCFSTAECCLFKIWVKSDSSLGTKLFVYAYCSPNEAKHSPWLCLCSMLSLTHPDYKHTRARIRHRQLGTPVVLSLPSCFALFTFSYLKETCLFSSSTVLLKGHFSAKP